jgi:hypothetical protein
MSREKDYYQVGERATRNDNGRRVKIVEARPVGFRVLYTTEDLEDGRTTVLDGRQLRPAPRGER